MMYILEIISMIMMLCLCFLCSKSDLRSGLIKNKTLLPFFVLGIIINCFYIGIFVNDIFIEYLLNVGIVLIVSILLFYSHSLAGGDCKMLIVLSIIFPARFYVAYGRTNLTLVFVIAFAIFIGYCYLFVNSIWSLLIKKNKLTLRYIASSLLNFGKMYILATLYIFIFNAVLIVLSKFGIAVNIWISRILCMLIAWCIGKYSVFRKKVAAIIVFVLTISLAIYLKELPFSVKPENYVLTLVLLFCQMVIKINIYENIEVTNLKKGMILSTVSTIMMQNSITPGLPIISMEDLRSRLTETEVLSVKKWAKSTKVETLTIVKKIPFAIFISIGFIIYLILSFILGEFYGYKI